MGRTVFIKSGEKIGRITGLDPAKPLFTDKDRSKSLNRTDAKFVDVIHTSSGDQCGFLGRCNSGNYGVCEKRVDKICGVNEMGQVNLVSYLWGILQKGWIKIVGYMTQGKLILSHICGVHEKWVAKICGVYDTGQVNFISKLWGM